MCNGSGGVTACPCLVCVKNVEELITAYHISCMEWSIHEELINGIDYIYFGICNGRFAG